MTAPTVEYRVFGNVAVTERNSNGGATEPLEADIAIVTLSWETRFAALGDHLDLKVKKLSFSTLPSKMLT
ncbi:MULTISPECIES: hypothetical protein [unclassified Rhizobium]|uniref:hypothetical protein n=1 Tax=unclassified Rhizobium TaxID=2613769 RepID=UPI001AE50805|nr:MULTISPECIES: hypothetical protein [unclassified Rhizobium]MBP2460147.1 hypothetical protein [Rhizobium sp. PvP014]MBP2531506.1 hypothetical protein [Rhizobium sp. PvP099]